MTDIMTIVNKKLSENDVLTRTQLDVLAETIDQRVPYRDQVDILAVQLLKNCPKRIGADNNIVPCAECQPFGESCYLRRWLAEDLKGFLEQEDTLRSYHEGVEI